jgi:hypothetical protein
MAFRIWAMAAVFCGVSVVARDAVAEERRVVVLMPRELPAKPWPEGTQSTIAELAAGRYQVLVESSSARTVEELENELRSKGDTPDAAGAIAILRDGAVGIAYVWARRDGSVVELRTDLDEGAVGEGAFALRITEWIRARDLPIPQKPKEPAAAPGSPEPKAMLTPPAVSHRGPSPLLWLGAGPVFSSAATSPLFALNAGVGIPLYAPLWIDASASVSLTPFELETNAGTVNVNARHVAGHVVVELWNAPSFSFALGSGGGLVWLDQNSEPGPGFEAASDATTVAVLSVRARARLKWRHVSFLLSAEPGLLTPSADIRADGESLLELGRPWVLVSLGIGWSP